jgi:hypothetical protein
MERHVDDVIKTCRPDRGWAPQDILNAILSSKNLFNPEEYTYIIMGRVGPTGKTWLCNELRRNGHNAIEITNQIYDIVDYHDEHNYFRRDVVNKQVIIVLNKVI